MVLREEHLWGTQGFQITFQVSSPLFTWDWCPGHTPGGGYGYPLQYSCLKDSMDRGDWWTVVHRVAKRLTRLK